MFRAVKLLIELFWVADVLDLPFMEIFDTTYQLNGAFWFITFIFLIVEECFEREISIGVEVNTEKEGN